MTSSPIETSNDIKKISSVKGLSILWHLGAQRFYDNRKDLRQ